MEIKIVSVSASSSIYLSIFAVAHNPFSHRFSEARAPGSTALQGVDRSSFHRLRTSPATS